MKKRTLKIPRDTKNTKDGDKALLVGGGLVLLLAGLGAAYYFYRKKKSQQSRATPLDIPQIVASNATVKSNRKPLSTFQPGVRQISV